MNHDRPQHDQHAERRKAPSRLDQLGHHRLNGLDQMSADRAHLVGDEYAHVLGRRQHREQARSEHHDRRDQQQRPGAAKHAEFLDDRDRRKNGHVQTGDVAHDAETRRREHRGQRAAGRQVLVFDLVQNFVIAPRHLQRVTERARDQQDRHDQGQRLQVEPHPAARADAPDG